MNLDDAQITAKCVEISKCLIGTHGGLVSFDLASTQTTGDAARLAVSIRNRSDKISREMLAGISSALKMDFRVVEGKIVPLFENLGWVNVNWDGKKLSRISEVIPPSQDILAILGKDWKESSPTVLEEASVTSLSLVSRRPFAKDAMISELNVTPQQFETTVEYGEQAGYLGKFALEERSAEAIWTPLYWASNSDQVMRFLKKQSDDVMTRIGSLAEDFAKHPGIPDELVKPVDANLVNAGISHGFFPSVALRDRRGSTHKYVFAASPQFEMDKKSDVFEKARMIVSCLRHGQYHAEVTRIRSPRSILNAMRSGTMKPHSYADVQYAILVLYGIVQLDFVSAWYGKSFKVSWIDTPENNLAAEIADQILRGEETIVQSKEELEAQKVLVEGVFSYSSEQRRLKTAQSVIAKKEYDRMLELVAGVKV